MGLKLKYQGGVTKKICLSLATLERQKFSKELQKGKLPISINQTQIDLDIISFSSVRDMEEQALSIYSFLFYVGIPKNWIIYSDGSYTDDQKNYLKENFTFIQFLDWNHNKSLEENFLLKEYLAICPLSKKLQVILSHSYERQTMYIDSDILFYKNALFYFNSDILKKGFWYLPDTSWGARISDYQNILNDMFELNSGLLILNKNFDFTFVYEYLNSQRTNFQYFSEQSSFNYAFKKQGANILDPRQFIVNLQDQFDFSMSFNRDEIAVRHYVTPVRHKMWQKGWRWHFRF
jgi:hypothetical protein